MRMTLAAVLLGPLLAAPVAAPAAQTTPGPAASASIAPQVTATPVDRAAAAKMATQAAKAITLQPVNGATTAGTVALTTIGRTRTRVTVRIPQGGNYTLSVHPGTDCNDNRTIAQSAIALQPINQSGGPESSTVVELPIDTLQGGNYVVDVRSATDRSALAQACARLTR